MTEEGQTFDLEQARVAYEQDPSASLAYIKALEAALAAAVKERNWLREALTPSDYTKHAYMGEFSFDINESDADGVEFASPVIVPWDTIKLIMGAIRDRAVVREPDFEWQQ